MDNYGFESKYSAQQIESMLDRMSCLPSYGLVKLDSSKQFPVDLDTIYDDFDTELENESAESNDES